VVQHIVVVVKNRGKPPPMAKRARKRQSLTLGLDLPPPYRLVTLREVGDAFAHAKAIAPHAGAGTLVRVGRFDVVEFAVVLEPEECLFSARRAFYAGLTALGDALCRLAPPERPITFGWPGAIYADGGLIGGARLAWPQGGAESEPPDWLVFGACVRTVAMGVREAGLRPLEWALDEAGFDDLGGGCLIGLFARYLMAAIDAWQEDGFAILAQRYLSRLACDKGALARLDTSGDLLVHRPGRREADRYGLAQALLAPTSREAGTEGLA
jgi:hypothetical protein